MNQDTDIYLAERAPIQGPGHPQLEIFVGRWKVEGRNASTAPGAPGSMVLGEETYEWLTGRFFLLVRWHRRFGDGGGHVGMGVIRYDATTESYVAHCFDNLGYYRNYHVSIGDHTLTYHSDSERGVQQIDPSGKTMTIHWEICRNGVWQPLCDLKATR